jgi:hypothetical protein
MPQQREYSAATRSKLARARLFLGAGAAAIGLFVALGFVSVPGTQLWLNHDRYRTESVAALEQASHPGSHRKAGIDRVTKAGRAAQRTAAANLARREHAPKTTAGSAGKGLQPRPATKQPGLPSVGDPPSVGENNNSGSTPPPPQQVPSPSPPPPPSPVPLVDVPQLPQVPEVPQLPVPTVPELPTPQVPGVPSPQLPTLP